ncbi:HAD family hydrolase [Mucilaginibacter antarcticus]|uniref:Beta-phosphoglucomutase n=1 Tax=Mucilaginibacter antarcticus TaxID=1855725 RepID=A0ABW5XPG3_9SPHI
MRAFLFDLNGTMIDDMSYHARAWTKLANGDLGGNFSPADIKREMYGKNPEVMVRMFGKDRFSADEMRTLSMNKENYYQAEYLPDLKLIDGLEDFLAAAKKAGIPMAIGSAAIPYNIDFVLDNLNIRHYFEAVVSADDVELSKPHPETFLKAAQKLQVSIADCIVFEDVPKGVEAAANAGMVSVVITTTHTEEEFEGLTNILHFAKDYTPDFFNQLIQS